MIYVAILTEKTSDEVVAISQQIEAKVSRFLEDYPDRENTFVEPWPEPRDVYVQQARSRTGLTLEIGRRLDCCRSVLYFEGPGNPQECPDQVSVLKLYVRLSIGATLITVGL
jgi:hypothetical protein